ncbi:fungal-specific transcription factor domain-containing protein [Xylariaceae sp. FL0016]|nr:fungal-specific transcription factor domain-containing protein [Xylariaceae sp. FL0016]
MNSNDAPRPQNSANKTRKRALEACNFCRGRKLKCSNELPHCTNCKTYGKDCVYQPLSEADRAEERRRRQKKNADIKAETSAASSPSARSDERAGAATHHDTMPPLPPPTPRMAHPPAHSVTAQSPSSRQIPHGVSRIVVSANGVPSYHGRTSAMFEENLQDRPPPDVRPRMPDEWVERSLVAEASKQRQLEEYHLKLGDLDFDGVDPVIGMHLLRLHWNRQHHSFLITYRPAFMRDMACNGPYFSKLLLNAIYFGASRFSPHTEVRKNVKDVRTAGWKFRERVRELLGSALDRSEITTIQALLIMTSSLFALGDERDAAWLYSGLAFRMITDLGLHVDVRRSRMSSHKFTDEDLEIRSRVYWGAFVVDKMQSLYQGRPVTLKESDASVPIKFLDTYEEFEHWVPDAQSTQLDSGYPGSPAYSVSTFTMLAELSVTMSDILGCIYNEHSFDQSPEQLSKLVDGLHSKLTSWKSKLPNHLVFEPTKSSQIPPPHVLSLHAMYNVLAILLHRPFVADGHLYHTNRAISVNSFMECASAATKIVHVLRAYDRAFTVKRAPYLLSYATYVAATIHARIAAKRDSDSDAHASLETCLAVFQENQETNWSARKAMGIVRNLIQRLGVNMRVGIDGAWKIDRTRQARTLSRQLVAIKTDGAASPGPGSARHAHGSGSLPSSQFNSTTSSPSNLDIDGVIQSFLREQDGSHGQAAITNDSVIAQMQMPNSQVFYPPQPQQAQQSQQPHQHQPPDHQPALNSYVQPQQSSWSQPTVDDLLFGFNGSALDDMPGFDWSFN